MTELILLPVLVSGAVILAHVHQRPPKRPSIVPALPKQPRQAPVFADQEFADTAAQSSVFGLVLCTLAIERSRNREIRRFAETMLQQNQSLSLELTAVLRRKGLTVTGVLEPYQRSAAQQLSQLHDSAFDREFVTIARIERQRSVTRFQHEIRDGEDGELRDLASSFLSKLRIQMRAIERLSERLTSR